MAAHVAAMTDCVVPAHGRLLAIADAAKKAEAFANPIGESERLPIAQALGRILAQPILARSSLPAFDNAAVDGYALASVCFADHRLPFEVPIVGRITAGAAPVQPDVAEGAVRIFTGAPVPAGFDTVLMQEHCERRGDHLLLDRRPVAGANVRLRGEDVEAGELLLAAGVCIDARHVALAAAVGAPHVFVRRRLRAAVLSIGEELREASGDLSPAAIYDSNRPMLAALLAAAGVDVTDMGVIRDRPERLAAAVREVAPTHDLIITTGGISVGDEDHVNAVMAGGCCRYERLWMAVKPGKPAALGKLAGATWLGLPGNGFAAFVAFLILGRPILRTLMGYRDRRPSFGRPAVAGFQWARKRGRDEFFPARHTGVDAAGRPKVEKLGQGGSARLRSLAEADGLAMVAADVAEVTHGSALTYLPFTEAWCP